MYSYLYTVISEAENMHPFSLHYSGDATVVIHVKQSGMYVYGNMQAIQGKRRDGIVTTHIFSPSVALQVVLGCRPFWQGGRNGESTERLQDASVC